MITAGDTNVLLSDHFDIYKKRDKKTIIDTEIIVNEVFEGKWKGEDKLKELFKEIRKTSKTMKKIMCLCIERRKKELKKNLKHQEMAALFDISEGNSRKWITVDLEIDWKEASKYRSPE